MCFLIWFLFICPRINSRAHLFVDVSCARLFTSNEFDIQFFQSDDYNHKSSTLFVCVVPSNFISSLLFVIKVQVSLYLFNCDHIECRTKVYCKQLIKLRKLIKFFIVELSHQSSDATSSKSRHFWPLFSCETVSTIGNASLWKNGHWHSPILKKKLTCSTEMFPFWWIFVPRIW